MSAQFAPAGVEARGWGWRHASRHAWALRDVSFRIEPGERVLVLGASGAGKSTLLHGLAGVLGGEEEGESEGALLVGGDPAAATRGRAGLVLQDPDSQVILARAGDDVAFGCENLGVPRAEIWPRVEAAMAGVGLDVPLDHPTAALSGGQKQRLALAGMLAMGPGLVLLDEPTANLDPEGVREVRDAVERMLATRPATLVVVEHRLEVWLPLLTRVIVLGAGGVVADGTPADVLGAQGERLAADGVWVPGRPPAEPPAPRTAPGEVLLSARGLAVARVKGRPVAQGIDLEVRAGEAVAITGPNGAGKSTLGLTLAGLLPPVSGAVSAAPVLAQGADPSPIRWASRELLTRIGMVFQEPEHQLLGKTVREELAVGPRALGLPEGEIEARIDELLARLRLAHLGAANPYTLSGGEKRRLTVAAAIATRPRVLILDEPTFGQDARTWAELVAMLAALRDEGSAIVTITHDLDVVRALHATRFALGAPA
ncbi:ABC transporter ATP-binding protein [Microbacterium paraoxydans]|jgi:energy-coupling factor transport system ATP-binding protein|uniref:Energy-coupling factor transport system ATP-binding protein n=2 Tax=Microbacterium paraoxydans TaxID=199592 RepID=A0A1H1RQA3_9MICO|nr:MULTISPECIES: ABC transporter ATP-binding protein [Microbacterium]SDS37209.1 energy-coupling factor transport system ATP-binding protein [Microbacterium paraoxydans]